MRAIKIARQQPAGRSRCAPDQLDVAFRHACEVIVDDDCGNRRDQTKRRREQGLGDASCLTGFIFAAV
jgi:hypothetical protein